MCHIRIRIFVSNFPLLTKKKALLMFRVYVKLTKKLSIGCLQRRERDHIALCSLSLCPLEKQQRVETTTTTTTNMSFASRSLFMKRGSGGHSASTPSSSGSKSSSSYGAHRNGGRRGEEEEEEGSSVRVGEKEEEALMVVVEKRNPVARAMSSSIGLLATAGLFIYGFGMMYGHKESVLERWRMTRSP